MSRKLQFVIALLIISSLTARTLNATPVGHPARPADREAGALTLFVDWVASLFSSNPPSAERPPQSPYSKYASQLDPNGHE